MSEYIYQQKDWPKFHWKDERIASLLSSIRHKQGRLLGYMEALGFDLRSEALLESLTINVIKSSEIEGEILNTEQVRSSIARKLGMEIGGLVPSNRNIDGVVEMMLDATQNFNEPLTEDRLFGWHSALFPNGRSGMHKIKVGNWRDDSKGPMQVVSGAMGREKIHFIAPSAVSVQHEMNQFLQWFNSHANIDPVLKASIAHFWFVTIHPFEDGNGRIARAIADMQLARADESSQRFYSMSAQIQKERNNYYHILESSQKGSLDITSWHKWFLECLSGSLESTDIILANTLDKATYWDRLSKIKLNERQILMLNKLLDGFEGKLTSSKWAKLTKCSQDTALRDIHDLIEKHVLLQEAAGGRSTSYVMTQLF